MAAVIHAAILGLPDAETVADRFLEAVQDQDEARERQGTYAAMLTRQRLPWLVEVRPIRDGSRAPGRRKTQEGIRDLPRLRPRSPVRRPLGLNRDKGSGMETYDEYKRRRMSAEERSNTRADYAARYAREKKEAAAHGREMQKPMNGVQKYLAFWVVVMAGGAEIECLIRGYPWAIVIAIVVGLIAIAAIAAKLPAKRLLKYPAKLYHANRRWLGYED